MPHNKRGNYYENSFLESVGFGLLVVIALAVILSVPGWITAAVWGWPWFFGGAALFWICATGLALIVTPLYAIGAIGNDDF